MARRAGKPDYAMAFGKALDEQLQRSSLRQTDVARATNVSPAYVNKLMKGTTSVSPRWADLIADVTKASAADRVKLHQAAAISNGYKLGTPDDKDEKREHDNDKSGV